MTQNRLKIGLKIYMTNAAYVAPALDHLEKNVCDFVEIAVDIRQTPSDLERCRPFAGRAVLHAPHSYAGLNPANPGAYETNLQIIDQVEAARIALSAEKIIFHPGIQGGLDETVRQFKSYFDRQPGLKGRVVIENKPGLGLGGEECCGIHPDEIRRLKDELGVGFCLDFGHAICAANKLRVKPFTLIEQFLKLGPDHFHLCDGWLEKSSDSHLHFGQGNYDIKAILSLIPNGSELTIEAPHDSREDLDDFVEDAIYLREKGA